MPAGSGLLSSSIKMISCCSCFCRGLDSSAHTSVEGQLSNDYEITTKGKVERIIIAIIMGSSGSTPELRVALVQVSFGRCHPGPRPWLGMPVRDSFHYTIVTSIINTHICLNYELWVIIVTYFELANVIIIVGYLTRSLNNYTYIGVGIFVTGFWK